MNIRLVHTNLPKQKELSLRLSAQRIDPDARYLLASSILSMLMPSTYTLYYQPSPPSEADNKEQNQKMLQYILV